jgi:hypothetical protein
MQKRGLLAGALIAFVANFAPGPSRAETHISGFVEATQALRIQRNRALDASKRFIDWRAPRSELRAGLKFSGGGDRDEYFVRVDIISDQVYGSQTAIDLREAYLKLHPYSWLDLKIGRQVATWGTGDLLFANDLFAKDWVAFFTGQELSYLKPPQDLIRVGIYTGGPTIEWAASPYYTMDNLPSGERLSIYNPFMRATVGALDAPAIQSRPKTLANAEWFLRVSGLRGNSEWALYGYRGYFPQPLGVTSDGTGPVLFAPRLASGGASLRGSLAGYLVNVEAAYYYSEDDKDGDDPFLPNSAVKLLAGAEKSLGNELSASVQWFGDFTQDYDTYAAQMTASGMEPADKLRHTATLRLTKFLRYQSVKLSFFGYWGISDEDVHLRPDVEYSFSDALKITMGANWLDGNRPYTMFGQFQNNSNLYSRVRYSF